MGGGGACQTQEKIVAAAAKKFVVVADYRKEAEILGTKWQKGIPIAFIPMAREPLRRALVAMGGAPTLRMGLQKAGPVVDDNGSLIYDVIFGEKEMRNPKELERNLCALP